jgi:predicted alpha/beta-fold hydrolase
MQILNLNNSNQEKLSAYLFVPPENSRFMVVICHGFRGAKENGGKIFGFAEKLQELGMGVLAFDFRGSGSSEGDFSRITLTRQAEDLRVIIDYVDSRFALPIILLGRSFGGSTVLAGGSHHSRIAGYVLWSTPIDLEKTFAAIMPEFSKNQPTDEAVIIKDEAGEYSLHPDLVLDFGRHNMESYLQNIQSRPMLIVNASDDEVVDPINALYIQEKIENCSLFMVDNAGHSFLDKSAEREAITLEWLRTTFK